MDAEPLTREDLQYDLLHHIFDDKQAVFTDPNPTLHSEPALTKVTFRDLYVNALVRSPRSSKVLREKMLDTPQFGTDFAKISLLANVGRINTTMACEWRQLSSAQSLCDLMISDVVQSSLKCGRRSEPTIPSRHCKKQMAICRMPHV